MENTALILEFISFLLSLLAALILLFINKEQKHTSRVLAYFLLILALITINEVVLYSGWYVRYPRLHKIVTPFTLLVFPLSYLYIRSIILGELKFRKQDWWLLVPAVLYAINLVPYYFAPIEEKREHVLAIYNDQKLIALYSEGIFPPYVFNFVRVCWSALFVILNFRLIYRFQRSAKEQTLKTNRELLRWLIIMNGLLTGLLLAGLYLAVIAPIRRTNSLILDLALGIIACFICIQLFIKPKLLYGIFKPLPEKAGVEKNEQKITTDTPLIIRESFDINKEDVSKASVNSETSNVVLHDAQVQRYKLLVEELFIAKEVFRNPDYSLDYLVKDTGIPRYVISAFINRQYGIGFREFLNRQRVNYFKTNLSKPAWENLTLEAIAGECGFSNRNTFIKNFKEITGETPSDYIKRKSS